MSESAIFQDESILVSPTLIEVGHASYPINGIASVSIRKPHNQRLLALGVVGVLVGLWWLINRYVVGAIGFILVGAICLRLNYLSASHLIIKTAGGDITLIRSRNLEYLQTIKAAIERAVTQRN
jgi:uncharacterized protein DUF6232